MNSLLARFESAAVLERFAALLSSEREIAVEGLNGAAHALLAAVVARRATDPVLYVAEDEARRQSIFHDLQSLLRDGESDAEQGEKVVMLVPDAQSQLHVLTELERHGEMLVIVTDADSLSEKAIAVAPNARLELALQTGGIVSRDRIIAWLTDAGFEATDLVTETGEFATRGGIIDVFPDNEDYPIRLELFDDRIESVRVFDPLTQRSVKKLESVQVHSWTTRKFTTATIRSRLPGDMLVIEETDSRVECRVRIRVRWTVGDESQEFGSGPARSSESRVSSPENPVRSHGRQETRSVAQPQLGAPSFDFSFEPALVYLGNFSQLKAEIEATTDQYYVVCADDYQEQRLSGILGDMPIYVTGRLSQGFIARDEHYVVLTEREIYGAPVMREPKRKFKGLPVDDLLALRKGDYVVHVNYGVGVFDGIKRLKVDDREHDFLQVRYAENGKVYVPVENLGLLDRYIGAEDRAPSLDRLGSRSWHLAKSRTTEAVSDYAEQLLDIYARRKTARGFAFSGDTPWQRELEATFIHEETPDQLRAISDMKRDLESLRPMDRLVCGDVGYGKTEVALRGAFKVAMDARQVAVLAPTTILAYQHFNTFKARTAKFPIRIAMLSRFVSTNEQARTRRELAGGRVDIVIGTHMLLSQHVKFKDLGLLIIDEEQKFGVRQKEKIKSLKAGVDVLTLSATPIPRTLYMSLVGLRDISTIHTPPAGRREILTDVQPWHDDVIRNYVMRETGRGGQVFFIHNRVESLTAIYNRLTRLCPELRIAMAHGQMPERTLARVYLGFAAGDYDMLVSTAIIESGLDLPRVNTIIVNRADRFGLADLHQLRGRVGRTQEQAHALFMVPDQHELADEARKRLSAILAYSQLGSGFKLAMRDMEIRGVGNLLGTEQHGHVARVGFSLYVQLLKEAVAKLKGEEVIPEPELAIDVEAFIPETFISDSYERVAIYKRLLSVESEQELDALREELLDRFGRCPPIVETLLKVALCRVYARQQRLLRVALKANRISLVSERGERIIEGGLDRLLAALKGATSRSQ